MKWKEVKRSEKRLEINLPITWRKKKHSPFSLNLLETNYAWSQKFEFTEEEKQIIVVSTIKVYRTLQSESFLLSIYYIEFDIVGLHEYQWFIRIGTPSAACI